MEEHQVAAFLGRLGNNGDTVELGQLSHIGARERRVGQLDILPGESGHNLEPLDIPVRILNCLDRTFHGIPLRSKKVFLQPLMPEFIEFSMI